MNSDDDPLINQITTPQRDGLIESSKHKLVLTAEAKIPPEEVNHVLDSSILLH